MSVLLFSSCLPGCIRLWNPLHALDEGTVLATADSDIGAFSLGDRSKGEHDLVMYVPYFFKFRFC
jgi:hypothetical protein